MQDQIKKSAIMGAGQLVLMRFLLAVGVAACAFASLPAFAQQSTGRKASSTTRVPFVGCIVDAPAMVGKSGTFMDGPAPAPTEAEVENIPEIDSAAASKLAYYSPGGFFGVLGPRGWSCLEIVGSQAATIFVTPNPFKREVWLSENRHGVTGPAIVLQIFTGETYVAAVIARVFPAYKEFAQGVKERYPWETTMTFGPYPGDKLIYKSDRVVEYRTPPNSEGLGTMGSLHKNEKWIDGVAAIVGPCAPSSLLLAIRLPPDMKVLESQIIRQMEREANSRPDPAGRRGSPPQS